jgi:hypothetical protein
VVDNSLFLRLNRKRQKNIILKILELIRLPHLEALEQEENRIDISKNFIENVSLSNA